MYLRLYPDLSQTCPSPSCYAVQIAASTYTTCYVRDMLVGKDVSLRQRCQCLARQSSEGAVVRMATWPFGETPRLIVCASIIHRLAIYYALQFALSASD